MKKQIRPVFTISLFTVLLLNIPLMAYCAGSRASSAKPNVVLIIIDDLGYGQMSCNPHFQDVRTPNLDALAAEGIRMTQAYSNDPMCAPTRQSLRSGFYFQRASLGDKKDAIGKYFKAGGYQTACIGKSQFSDNPVELGFDEFYGFRAGLHDYFESRIPTVEIYRNLMQYVPKMGVKVSMGENGLMYNIQRYSPILHNHEPVEQFDYLTIEWTNRAIDFVDKNRENPFFLYLSYNAVHHPHQAPQKYLNNRNPNAGVEDAEAQLAQIDCLDDEIGRLLESLEKSGLKENTLIMVVGDNGGLSFEGANWKLRGHKSRFYEGGIRVPWLVSWPGVLPEGKTYDRKIIHMDIVPTITAAAQLDVSGIDFDGVNQLPYLKGTKKEEPHDMLFWGRGGRYAVRQGVWKYIIPRDGETGLYNIAEDISESQNKIDQEPEIAKGLKNELDEWMKRMENAE